MTDGSGQSGSADVRSADSQRGCAASLRRVRPVGVGMLSMLASAWPIALQAQVAETTLIQPSLPEGFDRGRNVSVMERRRPDYDPLGIPVGAFNLFPRVETGLGGTSNTYLNSANPNSTGFAYVNPSVRADSNWSRHQVSLRAAGQLRGYFGESRRNEDSWNLGTLGRLDIGNFYTLTGEAQIARLFETPFSGEVSSELAVLSRYRRNFLSGRGEYKSGRGRALLALDYTDFEFRRIKFGNGVFLDQSGRDRAITRITGQAEYAFTPSLSIYGQGSHGRIRYDEPLAPGVPNRGSNGYRLIGGVNFDLAGRARGTIGVGYTRRSYRAAIYDDVEGFSTEAKVEFFPTELTTFTLSARRVIEDSNIGATNAFFDNRLVARVDHELLRNLLLNLTGELARQDYFGTPLKADIYRVTGGARYLSSRRLGLEGSISYGGRNTNGTVIGRNFDEVRGQVGVVLQI